MNRKNIPAEYLDAADYTDTKALPQWALDDLAASGLDQDSIRLMQCFPVLDSNHLKELLGFSNMDGQDIMQAVGDAYAIPYWENEAEEDGELPTRSFVRVKLQKPFVRTNGNEVKYLSPLASKECPFHAYFMPGEQAKFKKRKGGIVIVEGEKKAAKVAQDLRKKGDKTTIVIGFPGVTAWYDWAGWNNLKISGKQVWICFDAQDYGANNDSPYQNATYENCMVEDQVMKLWLFLMYEKKARDVKIITWDEIDQFKGIDDYLAANPDEIEELLDTASSPFEALPRFGAANGWQQLAEIIASLFMDKKTYTAIYESNNLQKRYGLSTKTWQQKMAAAIAKSHNTADKETTKQEEQTKEQTAPPEHTINWIDDKGRIITGLAAEAFIVSTKGNLIYVKENFYEFAGHIWKIIDDRVIANRIRDMVGTSKAKQTTINDILYQVTINLLERCANVAFNTHRNKLCFTNCVLDIDTMKVEEHNRTYLQTILFPYEYKSIDITDNRHFDEDMDFYAPNWTNFLNDLNFTPATIQRLQEWFGYMLVPTTKLERCLFLKGEGSNGKSTLLETLIAILGNEQVTSLEPQELFDKFKVCMIQDKLANICCDIETSQVFDARFKKLVSGEDQIGEEKQKRPFKFRPYARFIFSANDFIPTRDRSHAFFRRIDIVDFKRIFTEAEQDKDLKDKIKKEIPYIINWALKGLASLRKNNWRFTESQEFADTKAEFELAANPVKQFVDEEIQILTPKEIAEYEETPKIACDTFREKYTSWCKAKGHEVMAENKLGRELKRLGIEKNRTRKTGDRTYFYQGIQFR